MYSDKSSGEEALKTSPLVHNSYILSESGQQDRKPDVGNKSRYISAVGLVAVWIVTIVCVIATAVTLKPIASFEFIDEIAINPLSGQTVVVIVPLVGAALVTVCQECLGYIHTIALRWTLWKEGRLQFNTNLRLLTSSHTSIANHWTFNILYILAMAISYASVAQLFVDAGVAGTDRPVTVINLVALATLSGGLATQAALVTWAWISVRKVMLSWSPNPLNNALVCHRDGLDRMPGRSMVPYQKCETPDSSEMPTRPLQRQASLYMTRLSARRVVFYLWAMFATTVIISIVFFAVAPDPTYVDREALRSTRGGLSSGKFYCTGMLGWHVTPDIATRVIPESVMKLISVAMLSAMQLYLTFGLHCTELLVNATRDEKAWRRANVFSGRRSSGADLLQGSTTAALCSWETGALVLIKVILHWTVGQAVIVWDGYPGGLNIFSNGLFSVAGVLAIVASFGTFLACRRPPGSQPAAWGHIQTTVNLIDDWGHDKEPIYWGDKGVILGPHLDSEVRHAGTAGVKELVGPICLDRLYL